MKTVTILITDVQGSTAMATDLGDETAREVMRVHQEAVRSEVARHDGRVVKSMGDGMLAEFGSARAALNCAAAIQRAQARLNANHPVRALMVRVGVHTGEVAHEEGDILGEAVHASERITAQADGGQILLSDVIRRLVRSVPGCTFEDLGDRELKGFPELWRLYELSWSEEAEVGPVRTPFVDRVELDELRRHMSKASVGEGGLVLVSGEAGVGKTRLVEEAIASSALAGMRGTASERGTSPYAPLVSALREHLRSGAGGLEGSGPLSSHLAVLLPELGPEPASYDRDSLFQAIRDALQSIARRSPTVLFLDDLQWADATTLELLPSIADAARDWPLLVVCSYRSEEIPRGHPLRRLRTELRRLGRGTELTIGPLDARSTSALASRALDEDPGVRLSAALYDRTQGVPFFIEELCIALRQSSLLVDENGSLELEEGALVPVPETVRDAVRMRAEVLSEDARRCLEACAVIGKEVPLDLLSALGVESAVDELFELGMLEEREPGVGHFRHDLTREAIYADLTWSLRRKLHRSVADQLAGHRSDPRLVAGHRLASGDPTLAGPLLLEAARRFVDLGAYRDAGASLSTALEIWPEGEDESARLETLFQLGRCAQLSGELADAARAWEEVAADSEQTTDPSWTAEVKRSLASVYDLLGEADKALRTHTQAAERFAEAGQHEHAAAERLIVARRLSIESAPTASAAVEKALVAARRAGRTDLEAHSLALHGMVQAFDGRQEEGVRTTEEALRLALSDRHTDAAIAAHWVLGTIANHWSDYHTANLAFESAIELCRTENRIPSENVCLCCLGIVLYNRGDWTRAEQLAKDVLGSLQGNQAPTEHALCVLGLVSGSRGATKRARTLLGKSLALSEKLKMGSISVLSDVGLAMVDEIEGIPSTRWEHLLDSPPVALSMGYTSGVRWASTFAARRSDTKLVQGCADALAGWASRFGNAETLAALAHALGEVALLDADLDRAASQFARALELMGSVESPFECAHVQMRAGVALAGAGERDSGVTLMTDAYRTFRKLKARPFWLQAAADLEALGEPVDRRLGRKAARDLETGGLTRRELEILRLVAVGRTNREIAQDLFLSTRTIDMHVRNVLSKLGCRTRTEASSKAHALGLIGPG